MKAVLMLIVLVRAVERLRTILDGISGQEHAYILIKKMVAISIKEEYNRFLFFF